MADAQDSDSCVLDVQVQVLLPAPSYQIAIMAELADAYV